MRILLVDDDEALMASLAERLIHQRYAVDIAIDGGSAQTYLDLFGYDLVVLDLMLPDGDGIQFCRQFRSAGYSNPLMILTAKESTAEKVQALDAGADDYVVKPFVFDELCARIRALLRRDFQGLPPILQWGALTLDPSTCEVSYRHQPLRLTPKEFSIMELFLRHPHRVYSLGSIIDDIWALEDPPSEDAIRTHIKGLRRKLKQAGAPKDLIKTVYGLGYRLNENETVAKTGAANQKIALQQASEGAGANGEDAHREGVNQADLDRANATDPGREADALETDVTETYVAEVAAVGASVEQSAFQKNLAQAYGHFLGTASRQIAVLENTIRSMVEGTLTAELHHAGQMNAHKLAGSLGSFGISEGSQIARQLETQLRAIALFGPRTTASSSAISTTGMPGEASHLSTSDSPTSDSPTSQTTEEKALTLLSPQALSRLVKQLRNCFEQARAQSEATSVERVAQQGSPRLLIVSEDAVLSNRLVQAATAVNLQTQVVTTPQQAIRFFQPSAYGSENLESDKSRRESPVAASPMTEAVSAQVAAEFTRAQAIAVAEKLAVPYPREGTVAVAPISPAPLPDLLLLDISAHAKPAKELILKAQTDYGLPVVVLGHKLPLASRLSLVKQGVELVSDRNAGPAHIMTSVIDVLRASAEKVQVAIADDDPQMMTLLKTSLEPWGFSITTFESALSLWQWLANSPSDHPPKADILVLDIEMPQMTGIELCRVLRADARFQSLPILFLTVHQDKSLRMQAFQAGADDFIDKAVAVTELATRLRNQLARACRIYS